VKLIRPIAFAAFALTTQIAAYAQSPMKFRSLAVQFPDSTDLFPAGSHADAINNNCLSCHSRDMVLNQAPQPRTVWALEVDKMRHAFKAPVSDSDAAAIVAYLTATKGK